VFVSDITRFNQHTWHGGRLEHPDTYLSLVLTTTGSAGVDELFFYKIGKLCAALKKLFRLP